MNWLRNNRKPLVRSALLLAIALCVTSPLAIAYWLGYRIMINVSDSFPNRLYLAKTIDGADSFDKGTLVLFSMRLPNTPYENRVGAIDLLKAVSCVEGDYLERIDRANENSRFTCNGEPIAIVQPLDGDGKPYAISFIFNGVIPKDKLFVSAPHPFSFDSRYFGLIDKSQITGVVKCVIL